MLKFVKSGDVSIGFFAEKTSLFVSDVCYIQINYIEVLVNL